MQKLWIIQQQTLRSNGVSYLNLEIRAFLLLSRKCKETLTKERLQSHNGEKRKLVSMMGAPRTLAVQGSHELIFGRSAQGLHIQQLRIGTWGMSLCSSAQRIHKSFKLNKNFLEKTYQI